MVIRSASDRDLSAILSLAQQTPWDKSEYLERQLAAGSIVVAEERGLVGFIVWNREFFSLPCVWLVVVDSQHRRRGIASALYEHVEKQSAGSSLYSSTNESHSAMHAFFAKRGYRKAGSIDVDPGDLEIIYRIDLPAE
ncbi:MAG TPA: GNAT family N-acetyltransferase [Candidatus Rubrimentiphilum sp.]|nr:GNAT family N-acetyltransferase [Candidatus Rubrimentiphilum sp.]